MTRTFILDIREVDDGKTRPITVGGLPLLVCHSEGEFYVIRNQCSHAQARLTGGKLRGCRIFCPLHNSAFDLRTGEAMSEPASVAIDIYSVNIEEGRLYADLPDDVE